MFAIGRFYVVSTATDCACGAWDNSRRLNKCLSASSPTRVSASAGTTYAAGRSWDEMQVLEAELLQASGTSDRSSLPERSKLDNVRNVRQSNIGACVIRLTAPKIAGSVGQSVLGFEGE